MKRGPASSQRRPVFFCWGAARNVRIAAMCSAGGVLGIEYWKELGAGVFPFPNIQYLRGGAGRLLQQGRRPEVWRLRLQSTRRRHRTARPPPPQAPSLKPQASSSPANPRAADGVYSGRPERTNLNIRLGSGSRRPPAVRLLPRGGRKVRAPQDRVVGNADRPRGQGKCNRKQTANHRPSGRQG